MKLKNFKMGLGGAALLLTALSTGCDEQTTASEPTANAEELSAVAPGKEDNFFSLSAQEYMLTGSTTIELNARFAGESLEVRLKEAQRLVPYRQTVIGWFLNTYMVEKDHDADNKDHGGFKALTKNGSWEDLNLREVDELTFAFDFAQEIAGPTNLLSMVPTEVDLDGQRSFELVMGRISTAEMQRMDFNHEWYRGGDWSSFNPAGMDERKLERIKLDISPESRSADGWIDYAQLIDDGVLDIGVHFGWDYHKQYHIIHSRETYAFLVDERGFTSPVANYDALTRDSGPLTKDMLTPLGPVQVRISLFWGKPLTETDPDTAAGGRLLEQDMRASLKDRDVIVFSGHSGPFYGFALANWRKTDEGDLDDSELSSLDMPEDRYQVVFAEGCDTYAIGQGFFENPAKASRENLDIITTTSFSNASTADAVTDFIDAMVKTDTEGTPLLPSLADLLRDLDGNSTWFTTMYGVHGIDNNPQRHPFGDEAKLCGGCDTDADCGFVGNRCVTMADGERACTYVCVSDGGCHDGFVCQPAQSRGWIKTKVCVSVEATCKVTAEIAKAEVLITRVVPNPNTDLNGDGEATPRADEMVVLANTGNMPADLTGWSLADDVGVRFSFPNGYTLPVNETLSVFGGGDDIEWKAPRGLGLNNTGDGVRLLDARGGVVHEVRWDSAEAGEVIAP